MQQEKQRTIADTRQARTEPAIVTFFLGFLADFPLYLFPFHAKGRIGKRVIEMFPAGRRRKPSLKITEIKRVKRCSPACVTNSNSAARWMSCATALNCLA
jgi:hypothetical protein